MQSSEGALGRRYFSHSLRARYQETDQMGVVYHANFLHWMEIGRFELLREIGFPFRALEARGIRLVVVSLEIKFLNPAAYDDLISLDTRVVEADARRVVFESRVHRDEGLPDAKASAQETRTPLASAWSVHGWEDRDKVATELSKFCPELQLRLEQLARTSA